MNSNPMPLATVHHPFRKRSPDGSEVMSNANAQLPELACTGSCVQLTADPALGACQTHQRTHAWAWRSPDHLVRWCRTPGALSRSNGSVRSSHGPGHTWNLLLGGRRDLHTIVGLWPKWVYFSEVMGRKGIPLPNLAGVTVGWLCSPRSIYQEAR